MKAWIRLILVLVLVAVATTAVIRQRYINDRHRRHLAHFRKLEGERPRLADENRRLREAHRQGERSEAGKMLREEIERTKAMIVALERRIAAAESTRAAGEVEANRDPEKGMVKLEYFKKVGWATPAAAFQTAIWAAANADFAELSRGFGLDAEARRKARTMLEQMPVETRQRFDTPEKLVGVVFAHDFTDEEGFQITGVIQNDAENAIVRVRRLKHGIVQPGEKKIPLRRGPHGWQMVVSERMIEQIPDYLVSASLRIPLPKP